MLVKPKARAEFVLVLAEGDYTANVLLADLVRPECGICFEHDGVSLGSGAWGGRCGWWCRTCMRGRA